jgi:hypothetical protein
MGQGSDDGGARRAFADGEQSIGQVARRCHFTGLADVVTPMPHRGNRFLADRAP